MEIQEAIKLAKSLMQSGEKHQDYDRVVKLADNYMTLITGEEMERLLFQFIQRESKEMFDQRKRMTQSITPAIASSIMKPFYKVSRNDKVRKHYDFKDPTKNEMVREMSKGFFGEKRRKTRGLDYWLNTRFIELTFIDPNAWVVVEWETPRPDQPASPHPFEVTAREAVNFKYWNEELQWLFVQLGIKFTKINDKGERVKESGRKWTLYDKDYTVVICQVCPKQLEADAYVLQPGEELIEVDKNHFLVSVYEPKVGFVTASRVGYNRDEYTKGRTFVNPFHPAMPFFMKSIKTVSEMDLTMSLHTFPQKLQYVERCSGESREKPCHNGYVNGTADKCGSCKGTGYKFHTTAQDAILLPMPDSKEEMIPLDDLLVYKAPPIDLIKFQDEYTKGLKMEAHLAVFNSQIFVNPDLQVAKTATEVDANMQGVYDTLDPYTEKVSELWKDIIYVFAHLAAVDKPEDAEIVHKFPADPKLKTTAVLLAELAAVNESGAPSFMRDAISEDLARIIYSGDELGYLKYHTKHKFFPFNGKTPDEIAMLVASQFVSKFTKVLYANFEAIFNDIQLENPGFFMMKSYSKQWTIVQDKVNEYMEELGEDDPIYIDFGSEDTPGTPGDPSSEDDASEGDGNPGEDGDDDAGAATSGGQITE